MKQKKQNNSLSPEAYIRQKGRELPIYQCYINEDWKLQGMAIVTVIRRHKQGTYTFASYLTDTFCLGVKDSFYSFSIPQEQLDEILSRTYAMGRKEEIDYNHAHNLIFEAIAFAEEAGITPHKSFQLTQYLLEEDSDDIPLIEYEMGKNGKHFLISHSQLEASRYLPLLKKNLGEGNYKFLINTDEEYDEDYDDEEESYEQTLKEMANSDWFKEMQEKLKKKQQMPNTPYLYIHPEYPKTLELNYPELYKLLVSPENHSGLCKKDLKHLLTLDRDKLAHDLEQVVLYETGLTCDQIPPERDEHYYSPIMNAIVLLGEVHSPDSLTVVLETMRQNEEYCEFHCGDISSEIYVPTLYKLGKDRLHDLMSYIKEPGLYTFYRYLIFPAIALIAREQPARRAEVINWFREVLQFYTATISESTYCDGSLTGMMTNDLLDIRATELLPELKALYDTGMVDEMCCGDYETIEKEMSTKLKNKYLDQYELDIRKQFEGLRKYDTN